jgi:ABC-type Zn uptake system ZnuABC Zn-binding protein ZnuA
MRFYMKRIFCLFMWVSALLFASLLFASSPAVGGRVKVVTTLSLLRHLAEEVGGDLVSAENLCSPKQDPHYLEAKLSFQRKAHEADLFISLGLDLDKWAKDVVDGSGNIKIQVGQPGNLIASKNIKVRELSSVISREWGDIHPYGNPHVWLDPVNVRQIAFNIAEALKKIDSANKDAYDKRLKEFQKKLDEAIYGADLVKEVGGDKLSRLAQDGTEGLLNYLEEKKLRDKLGGWLKKAAPLKGLRVLTYHKTWIYFTDRFQLDIRGEIEEKPGIPPTSRYIDDLIKRVKDEKAKVIEVDIFYPTDGAKHIADKTGAKVIVLPIDVGSTDATRTYIGLIDYVVAEFLGAVN